MANRFWVLGTGTWDASDTTHWATTSGAGSGGASVPGASDVAIFDASSGGGTVTVNTTVAITSITAGAFTGTLDFGTNNNNVTLSGNASFTGSGTRSINMGSGTWTFTGGGKVFDCATSTNLTPTFQNAPLVLSANSTSREVAGGGQTLNSLTVSSNSTKGQVLLSNTGTTFSSITVNDGNTLVLTQLQTFNVSGALTMTGTSSAPVGLMASTAGANIATLSVGSASTIDWGAIFAITESGAGTITASNSFDLGRNTNITITAPSGGGGGGQRVFGG